MLMVYYSPTPALLSELTYLAGLADWEARAVELALTHCYRGVPLFVLAFSLNSKLALGFISQGRLFLIHLVSTSLRGKRGWIVPLATNYK